MNSQPANSVVLVEEHHLFRGGLRTLLQDADLPVLGEYTSVAAALAKDGIGEHLEPGTVVLCSLTLDGWRQLVRHLLLHSPHCPILGLVDDLTQEVAIEALTNGVLVCMDRTLPPEQWVETIQNVHAGTLSPVGTVLRYPAAARHALITLSQPVDPPGLHPLAPALAHRERLALGNVSEGVPMSMIVEQLGLPEQEVHDALASACRKLVARQRLSGTLDQLR